MSKYFEPFTLMLTHNEMYYLNELAKERQVNPDSLIASLIIKEYNPQKREREAKKNVRKNSI